MRVRCLRCAGLSGMAGLQRTGWGSGQGGSASTQLLSLKDIRIIKFCHLQLVGIAELNLEGDFKKTKLKLTWLAQSDECPQLELQVG